MKRALETIMMLIAIFGVLALTYAFIHFRIGASPSDYSQSLYNQYSGDSK